MARIAGRNARVYVAIASGGTAEPITFIKSFTFNRKTDRYDATSFGDDNKVTVQGLPDASGDANGFYDTATAQFYTAASDGLARKTYFYEDITLAGSHYWFTTAFWDMSGDFPVDNVETISASWASATSFVRVG